ncbi:MAG: alpha/beta hydrolase [Acetobacteraceae bacterium]|nr:alpha/beta hydrolase [Acetobacteraceae bacterium]MBV8590359.1 alpha/beta hydrolase [Acetobacteraceae bacterium]
MTALERALADAEQAGIKRNWMQVGDLLIHYARFGRGRPLLLLHGWPEFWLVWRPMMERLGDQFDLIAPDLRGFGDTGKPSSEPDPTATADRHADDMLGLIDGLGLRRFGLVGGDVGAYVMQAISHRAPERLAGAFYFSTPYPGMGARTAAPGRLTEVWYQYFQQLPWAAQLVGTTRQSCHLYLQYFLTHWSGDNPAVFADMLDVYTGNYMKPGNLQGGFDWYLSAGPARRAAQEGTLPKRPPITVPSRMLWGKRDPLFPIEWADRLGEYFADYSIDFVEAGHFVHAELPEQSAREVRAFFQSRQF